jgi:hypothetical protein
MEHEPCSRSIRSSVQRYCSSSRAKIITLAELDLSDDYRSRDVAGMAGEPSARRRSCLKPTICARCMSYARSNG